MIETCVLSQSTLVLNQSWLAIATTSVRHALGLLYTGAARAVQPDTYEVHGFASWTDLAVPFHLPVLRRAAGHRRADDRPRHAALARRA